MAARSEAQAVLVIGVYGAGKSTVVADIGGMLESRGERYGVLDVDWLGWFDAGGGEAANRRVTLSNVRAVCDTYLREGVRRLALAWSIRDAAQLEAARLAVPVPVRVVRLDVSAAVVEQRLSGDPTEERRRDDLRVAREWLAAEHGWAWRTSAWRATGRSGRRLRRSAPGSGGPEATTVVLAPDGVEWNSGLRRHRMGEHPSGRPQPGRADPPPQEVRAR